MQVKALAVLMLMTLLMLVDSWMAVCRANENKGAENIDLKAGSRGNVFFPHRRHQNKLGDCRICHSVFPQKAGSIAELKAEGKLKQKYVMNKLCTKCHKEKKKAGQPSGPTTCSKCHIKNRN